MKIKCLLKHLKYESILVIIPLSFLKKIGFEYLHYLGRYCNSQLFRETAYLISDYRDRAVP